MPATGVGLHWGKQLLLLMTSFLTVMRCLMWASYVQILKDGKWENIKEEHIAKREQPRTKDRIVNAD